MAKPTIPGQLGFFYDGGVNDRWVHDGTDWVGFKVVIGTGDSLPIGTIVSFSGDVAAIPTNWAVCDGTGGTPDLHDKFIKATSLGDQVGDTGGSTNTNVSVVPLQEHGHLAVEQNVGAHEHSWQGYYNVRDGNDKPVRSRQTITSDDPDTVTAPGSGGHTHDIAVMNNGSGEGEHSHVIDPPFYKLLYIIKLTDAAAPPAEERPDQGLVTIEMDIAGLMPSKANCIAAASMIPNFNWEKNHTFIIIDKYGLIQPTYMVQYIANGATNPGSVGYEFYVSIMAKVV